jgi:hypothetical protein
MVFPPFLIEIFLSYSADQESAPHLILDARPLFYGDPRVLKRIGDRADSENTGITRTSTRKFRIANCFAS